MIPRFSFSFIRVMLALALVSASALRPARAATCTDAACVEIGGRLASIDTDRSYLLNCLLGQLLGTSISLQVVDWQALTAGQVNLLDLLQAVQAQATLSNPQQALDLQVDAVKILNATASALQAKGNTIAANAVLAIAARIGPGTIKLGDFIDACVSCVSYADTQLNVLDLVMGVVSLYNYDHMVYTPTPITVNAALPGLPALATVKLYAQILEKPKMICRTPGSVHVYGAAIRIKLDVALPSISLNAAIAARLSATSTTLGLDVANVQAQLTHISVYATVAQAEGILQSVDAVAQVVKLQAVPGLVSMYVGDIDDAVFFTHSSILASDLKYGTIGALQLSVLGFPVTAAITAKAKAIGAMPGYTAMTFSGPFPEQQTVSSSSLAVSNLVTTLLNSLDIDITVTGGLTGLGLLDATVRATLTLTLNTLKPVLIFVYQTALSPIVNTLLTNLVDPMLCLLGIQIGEAYVTVLGARRFCSAYTVSGTVYRDANRNGFIDGSESGTGLTLWAKLVSDSTPAGPASQVVSVNSTTGAYSFTNLTAGTYRIVIDDNNTPADVTPLTLPAGWTATEQTTLMRTGIAVASDLPNQNFGLANASTIVGRVFHDTGTGGGTAHDGVRNGGEVGVGAITLQLLDAGSAVLDTTTSAADGTYRLFIPSSVSAGASLRIVETNLGTDVSTGASPGTTGGTYQRTTDTVSFSYTAGAAYTGVDFGDAPFAQLTTDGQQTALPGTTVYYPHRFIAGSAGSVTFSTSHTLDPAIDGWSELVFLDSNGNGQLDSGEPLLSGATTITEGQIINVVVKVFVPNAATYGARNQTVLRADVTYTGATPALTQALTHTDLTITGASGTAGLALTKTVDRATAKPGDTITYTVTFTNESSAALHNIVVSDATPAFTRFVSANVGTVPTALGAATLSLPSVGAAGAIRWTFAGELGSGATGTVVFVVQVEQ